MSNFKLCQYSCDINNQINICARQKQKKKLQTTTTATTTTHKQRKVMLCFVCRQSVSNDYKLNAKQKKS